MEQPENWPGWPRMISRPTRYIGVILSAVVAVALALYFLGPREAGGPGAVSDVEEQAERGGQIVGSIRSEPRSFNRMLARDQASDLVGMLTQGRLVRTNRVTFELEPWLAERWESSADGLTHTLHLRPGLVWSDGAPLTSADVLFSLQAALDPAVNSVIAGNLTAGGQPIRGLAYDEPTSVRILRELQLITGKRMLYVANVEENDLAGANPMVEKVRQRAVKEGSQVVTLSARLEAEIAERAKTAMPQ